MSGEQSSSIDNLPQNISKEDLDLVNDILSDLGNSGNNQEETSKHPSNNLILVEKRC